VTGQLWGNRNVLLLVSGFGDNILAIALMWIAGSPGQPRRMLPIVGVLRVVPLILAAPSGV